MVHQNSNDLQAENKPHKKLKKQTDMRFFLIFLEMMGKDYDRYFRSEKLLTVLKKLKEKPMVKTLQDALIDIIDIDLKIVPQNWKRSIKKIQFSEALWYLIETWILGANTKNFEEKIYYAEFYSKFRNWLKKDRFSEAYDQFQDDVKERRQKLQGHTISIFSSTIGEDFNNILKEIEDPIVLNKYYHILLESCHRVETGNEK